MTWVRAGRCKGATVSVCAERCARETSERPSEALAERRENAGYPSVNLKPGWVASLREVPPMAPGFVRVAGCPRRAGALGLLLVLAGGCVVGSREPLYERSRDAAFDPWLVGTWRGRDGSVTISRGTGRSYVVVGADAEGGGEAEAGYFG